MDPITLIDTIASGRDSEVFTRVRSEDGGVAVVQISTRSSALLEMHRRACGQGHGFSDHQLAAGVRFESDHMLGVMGASNAATIAAHLERSLSATQSELDAAAFGRVMRAKETQTGAKAEGRAAAKIYAAHRHGYIRSHLTPMSWRLLEMLILLDMRMSDIDRETGFGTRYLSLRIREALTELAVAYERYDAITASKTSARKFSQEAA